MSINLLDNVNSKDLFDDICIDEFDDILTDNNLVSDKFSDQKSFCDGDKLSDQKSSFCDNNIGKLDNLGVLDNTEFIDGADVFIINNSNNNTTTNNIIVDDNTNNNNNNNNNNIIQSTVQEEFCSESFSSNQSLTQYNFDLNIIDSSTTNVQSTQLPDQQTQSFQSKNTNFFGQKEFCDVQTVVNKPAQKKRNTVETSQPTKKRDSSYSSSTGTVNKNLDMLTQVQKIIDDKIEYFLRSFAHFENAIFDHEVNLAEQKELVKNCNEKIAHLEEEIKRLKK